MGVKYVITDLNEAYRTIIKGFYTNAIHIADRFHVTNLIVTAFNRIRINRMNFHKSLAEDKTIYNNREHKKYYNLLKKNYKLLISNKASHDSWYYDQIVYTDKDGVVTTMNDLIEQCINSDSQLESAYSLLQSFYRVFRYSNQDNARQQILNWCDEVNRSEENIYELKKATITIKNWINEICNSFILNPITHQRMTNGFIEGKNNLVKVIKRVGFGYKDFDLFRIRILETDKKDK